MVQGSVRSWDVIIENVLQMTLEWSAYSYASKVIPATKKNIYSFT